MKRCHVCDLLVVVLCLVLGSASPALAQPPQPGNDQGPRNGQQGQRGPGGPGGFFGGGMLGLVMRPEVQQELQLVDEQKDKLRTLTDDMRNKLRDQMRDLFGQMQNLSPEERRAKFG
ncbi:MAG TPA: hypothetical protein VHE81_23230, partial [Lacipirellulaceae bacterium]|nr:hypothetical protein [Lacipirellulaceae bacterium]